MSAFDVLAAPLTGISLIDASAGTGKTYTIANLVLRLLLEKNQAIRNILVVTYTEAATGELREKIRNRILEARDFLTRDRVAPDFLEDLLARCPDRETARQRLGQALQGFDEAAVFTIHGFCQRMLWENNLETGTLFDTELVPGEGELLQEIVEDYIRIHLYNASSLFIEYAGKQLQIKKLQALLKTQLNKPGLQIIPAISRQIAGQDLPDHEQRYIELFEQARLCWQQSGAEAVQLLLGAGLHGSRYKPDNIRKWSTLLAAVFASKQPALFFFDKFEKFTTRSIAKAVTKRGGAPPAHPLFDLCEKLLQAGQDLAGRYEIYATALRHDLFRYAGEELEIRKFRRNVHSFDDLLRRLHKSLAGVNGKALAGAIRSRYPVALIDEFQDTDPVQYGIFDRIYGSGKGLLFLIGDPKQSIYSFRGADIFTYIKATARAGNRSTLKENWRSSPELIRAVNTVFRRVPTPFLFEEIKFVEVEPANNPHRKQLILKDIDPAPMQLWLLARSEAERKPLSRSNARESIVRAVAGEIVKLLQLGRRKQATINNVPLSPGDIAILVRTNRQARRMQEVLAESGIAAVLHSSGNLFAGREAAELEIVLLAIAQPGHEHYLKAALATEMFGVTGSHLDEYVGADEVLEGWRAKFYLYHDLWEQYGFIRMFREVLDSGNIRQRLLGYHEGERRITNVLHLQEVLHRASVENNLGPAHLLQYLAARIADSGIEDEEHQLRLESDADRVRIVTVHKAKGLQYPVVFCPFAWEGPRKLDEKEIAFHQRGGSARPVLDLGSPEAAENLQKARHEQLAEDIRLLYVALTRAEFRVYLCWGGISGADFSGMGYLLHQAGRPADDYGTPLSRLAEMNDGEIAADLEKIVVDSGRAINVIPFPTAGPAYEENRPEGQLALACKAFGGSIDTSWRIASFSSLTTGIHEWRSERPDPDNFSARPGWGADQAGKLARHDIFTFPVGAAAGVFMHDLLEHLDFTAGPEMLAGSVTAKLVEYGYDQSWQEAVSAMIDNVLNVQLLGGVHGLSLAEVANEKKIAELEFYYPVKRIGSDDFLEAFHRFYVGNRYGFYEKLRGTGLPGLTGFLKGFIDLVFEFGGKYYIIDWKSNLLGDGLEYYQPVKLDEVMHKEMYVLQYHIYALALHRYLACRLANYDYQRDFGGVFYIFLRGVYKKHGTDSGVFYDKPSSELITEIDRIIGYVT